MNSQAFSAARAAYQRGDWAGAVSALTQAKTPQEQWGEADHLLGNALMKLGRFSEAADSYGRALSDASYTQTHMGALNCNRGRAFVGAGMDDAAVACFEAAAADPNYPTPYKAYVALGNLYLRSNMPREAGVAWRNAAIDESNPNPSTALVKLGSCFMQMGRPVDAVEAYRTALDFSSDTSQGPIYAELGQAYMAANRVAEAIDAFTHATADGLYQLTSEQASSLSAAQKALNVHAGSGSSETDQLLAGYGYSASDPSTSASSSASFDPLDPMGKSGEFIPSPEDTGFFSVTEQDLMEADKQNRKMRKKHSGRGKRIVIIILLLVIVLAAAGGFAYYKGYGWPTQEAVVMDMFSAGAAGNDVSDYLASSLSSDKHSEIQALIPKGSKTAVSGVDRSMQTSQVLVTVTLASGGTQNFTVNLVRNNIGWKVSDVQLSYASQVGSGQTGASSNMTSSGTLATPGSAATDAAQIQTTQPASSTTTGAHTSAGNKSAQSGSAQ